MPTSATLPFPRLKLPLAFPQNVVGKNMQVLNGRPVPFVGTTLFLPSLPRGFPEFVCFVGQLKPDKAQESTGEKRNTLCIDHFHRHASDVNVEVVAVSCILLKTSPFAAALVYHKVPSLKITHIDEIDCYVE